MFGRRDGGAWRSCGGAVKCASRAACASALGRRAAGWRAQCGLWGRRAFEGEASAGPRLPKSGMFGLGGIPG